VRICIIGAAGHLGTAFDAVTPVTFIGIAPGCAEEDPLQTEKVARERGIPHFPDWRGMLDSLSADAAVVNTIYAYNGPIAEEALRRGMHVYCEKPVSTTLPALESLEKTAAASDRLLFAMLTTRFDSPFFTAKRLLDSGAVGEVRMVTGQKSYKLGTRPAFYSDRALYGGTLPWIAIHALDQILWLTGLPCEDVRAWQSSRANGGNGTMEMTAMAQLRLAGDVLASVHAEYLRPQSAPSHGDDRVRIAGTGGVLEVRGGEVYLTDISHDGLTPLPQESTERIFDAFLRLCADPPARRDPLYCDCAGIEATRVALRARESADDGQITDNR